MAAACAIVALGGCSVVGTSVGIAAQVVETSVDVTTDVVGTVITAPAEIVLGGESSGRDMDSGQDEATHDAD